MQAGVRTEVILHGQLQKNGSVGTAAVSTCQVSPEFHKCTGKPHQITLSITPKVHHCPLGLLAVVVLHATLQLSQ